MIYKFFVKLTGAGIAAVILFTPLQLHYSNHTLTIQTRLKNPVTREIKKLVKNGFIFGIQYYAVVIINDQKSCKTKVIKRLSFKDGWLCNHHNILPSILQEMMGRIEIKFTDTVLKDGDELLIFIKSAILPDEEFKKDVGMSTRILWNHYVPRVKENYIFKDNTFIKR